MGDRLKNRNTQGIVFGSTDMPTDVAFLQKQFTQEHNGVPPDEAFILGCLGGVCRRDVSALLNFVRLSIPNTQIVLQGNPDVHLDVPTTAAEILQLQYVLTMVGDAGGMGEACRTAFRSYNSASGLTNEKKSDSFHVISNTQLLVIMAGLIAVAQQCFHPDHFAAFKSGLRTVQDQVSLYLQPSGNPHTARIQSSQFLHLTDTLLGSLPSEAAEFAVQMVRMALSDHTWYPELLHAKDDVIPYYLRSDFTRPPGRFTLAGRQSGVCANPDTGAISQVEQFYNDPVALNSELQERAGNLRENVLKKLIRRTFQELDAQNVYEIAHWICAPLDGSSHFDFTQMRDLLASKADQIQDPSQISRQIRALGKALEENPDVASELDVIYQSLKAKKPQLESAQAPFRVDRRDLLRMAGIMKNITYYYLPGRQTVRSFRQIDHIILSLHPAFDGQDKQGTSVIIDCFQALPKEIRTSPVGKAFAECIGYKEIL